MVTNRYMRLQESVIESFNIDAPVEIEKWALLFDKQNKKILLQSRINILDDIEISSLKLLLDCLDKDGEKIIDVKPFIEFIRDINLLGGKSFGEKTPIVLDPRVRKVKVAIGEVTYTNGMSWIPSTASVTPPLQKNISSIEPELLEQLNRDIQSLSSKEKERVIKIPQCLDEYWLCACGRPNGNNSETCCRCGKEKSWIFANVSEEGIRKNLEDYRERVRLLEEEKARKVEEERIQKLEEKRFRSLRAKKICRTVSLISTGIGICVILYFFVLSPYIKYSHAEKIISTKDYGNAISLFTELGSYKDSPQKVLESKYQLATQYLSEGKYTEGITAFEELGSYKDSPQKVLESKYQLASQYHREERYVEGIALFEELGDYKASIQLLKETKYLAAIKYFEIGQFSEGFVLLEEIPNYKDSNELLIFYQAAVKYMDGEFDQSKLLFEKISSFYEEANSYIQKIDVLNKVHGTWEQIDNDLIRYVFYEWKYAAVIMGHTFEYELPKDRVSVDGISIRLGGIFSLRYDAKSNTIYISSNGENSVLKKISDSTPYD